MNNRIIEAMDFTRKAHEGQFRKYVENQPYVNHPIRVAFRVAELDLGEDNIISALLHDVVEDTKYTFDDIREKFGWDVEDTVNDLTNFSHIYEVGKSREKRVEKNMEKISILRPKSKIIKMLDRIDNLNEMDGAPATVKMRYINESIKLYYVTANVTSKISLELSRAIMNLSSSIGL